MKPEIIFNDSAFKHGVTESDIRKILVEFLFEGAFEDDSGKFLIIGFDIKGTLVEIMYNIKADNTVNVFHAMKCRKEFVKLIER